MASLPPISSEVFTDKFLQARAASTAEADKAGFERLCETCQKTYYSENSYQNHISSAKHRARLASVASKANGQVDDESKSMISSTFSLGEPAEMEIKSEVDSDAEEEFNEVIEGFKKTGLQENTSPVKRPSNPHLSAAGQHKADHPISESPSGRLSASAASSNGTPTVKASGPALSLKSCLFCNYESPTLALNIVHMERIHGMFVPEKNYLVDLEGLIAALQQRVVEFHECLFCGKVKANTFAAQTHMRDTGHCKIPYTTEDEQLEIGEFYDFRATYSDEEEEEDDDDTQGGGAKLGARRTTKVTADDDSDEVMHEDGWETDSSASSLDSNDLHAVPAERHDHQYERLTQHPHHSRDDSRAHHQKDGWHAHNHKRAHAVFYDDYELHLPSGKSVGHRSLNRYFRQNLHNYPTPEERAERLAIEAAEAENEMDVDSDADVDDQRVARQNGAIKNRAVVNRELRGLGVTSVTDPKMEKARRAVMQGRKKEFAGKKTKELGVSKLYFKEKHRNHATYLG